MFCNRCGHEIKPGDKFCEHCGAPVVQPVVQPSGNMTYYSAPNEKPRMGKRKALNIAFVVLGITAVLSFYGYRAYRIYRAGKYYMDVASDVYSEVMEEYDVLSDEYDDEYAQEYEEEYENDGKPELEYVHMDAPEYKGEYNYFSKDKWVIAVEDQLLVNAQGKTNDKLVGMDTGIANTVNFTEGMLLTEEGVFYYFNSDTALVEFAPGAKCAEIALNGGKMFYVVPEKRMGKNENVEVGSLYIFDTATGFSEMLAEDVEVNSPVISPDGSYVAYTRFVNSDKMMLCIGGSDKEEQELEEGRLRACTVTDEGELFYTDKDRSNFFRYREGKSDKVLTCDDFKKYYTDRDVNEIMIICSDSAYYCDMEMEKAEPVLEDDSVMTMYTPGFTQTYGQFDAHVSDVESLKDMFYVTEGYDVFFINSDGKGASSLERHYKTLDNIMYEPGSRELLYSCKGVLYRSKVTDEGIEEKTFYDDKKVEYFIAGYDFKDIWIVTNDDICYLKGNEAVTVVPDYVAGKKRLKSYFGWNIEDNKLYFVENDALFSVYDRESSLEKVAENCDYIADEYGKLIYITPEEDYYIYIDGAFVKIY